MNTSSKQKSEIALVYRVEKIQPKPQGIITMDSNILNKYMKEEIDRLRDVMPISNRLISMDRESNLRMAVSYLRVKRFFEGIPENQDEWQTKSQILHILDFFCFVLDSQLRFLYVTESVCLHLGLSQFQIIGLPISDFVHPEDYEKIHRWMTKSPPEKLNSSEKIVEDTIRFKYRNSSRYRKGFTKNGYKDVLVSFNFHFCNCVEGVRYCKTAYGRATIIDNTEYFPAFHLNKYQFVLRLSYHFKVVFVDYSAIDFLGCYPAELLDQSIYQFIHPEDTRILAAAHRKTDYSNFSEKLWVNILLNWCKPEGMTSTEASAPFFASMPVNSNYVKMEKAAGEHSNRYHSMPAPKADKRTKKINLPQRTVINAPVLPPLNPFPTVIQHYPTQPAHQVTVAPVDPFPSLHGMLPTPNNLYQPLPDYSEYWHFEPQVQDNYYFLQPL